MSTVLWQPSEEHISQTRMYRFMTTVNEISDQSFENYDDLYHWSVDNIPEFWGSLWDFLGIIHSSSYDRVVDDLSKMPGATWFEGARLNFAENLLRYRDDRLALIFKSEDQPVTRLTYAELYKEVARVSSALKACGVEPGDRVAGFMPNMPQTIIAMLAATSLGATWSSCSPDFGAKGVLDRFGQIEPKVLFMPDGYTFKGKHFESIPKVAEILKQISSIRTVVVVPYIKESPDLSPLPDPVLWDDFTSPVNSQEIEFAQLPFNHPLYIMYSSGTTGLPKCMVQSAGGILMHHLKELALHTDLKRDDTIFYFTTCSWMMWNWLVSALGTGATIVLFDGNPFHPAPGTLWELAQEEGITVFGTSAGYLAALQNAGVKPRESYDLTALRAVLSTGSPLSDEGFEYVYRDIKPDIQLASISGGTDLNGCFALGNPMGGVYAGEIQCRGLGMKVEAFGEDGNPVTGGQGELVCTAPFPSMPIHFWNDPEGQKYHEAYFDVYPNVWRHGDFIEINDRGGVVIYGRSDATLNPGGVRIGTAEIYRQIETMPEIEDSLVVGQNWKNDVRVILFVMTAEGTKLSDELIHTIRTTIRKNASPRHVPAKILAVPDIPYTHNMKKVELAVKKIIHGQDVNNWDALRNPESLNYFVDMSELQED